MPPMPAVLALVLLPAAAIAAVQDAPPAPEESLVFATLEQRMTVPVSVAGGGPYPFVVDTGAQRTVIARQLAEALRLAAGPRATMTTMTGSGPVRTVTIPHLSVGGFAEHRGINAPALEEAHLGASGLLGIDALAGQKVTIDFASNRMAVQASTRRPRRAAADEIVVTARSMFGQLIVTDAAYAGERIRVVIDTGASVSVGNSRFRRLVQRHTRPQGQIRFYSVTGAALDADYASVSKVRIGGLEIRGLPVAFADVPPFAKFGLDDRPALLLGMGALRAFRQVDIDFANREIRMRLPRA